MASSGSQSSSHFGIERLLGVRRPGAALSARGARNIISKYGPHSKEVFEQQL